MCISHWLLESRLMFLCQYNTFKILIGFRNICSLLVHCAYNHIQNSFPDIVLKSVLQFCFLSLMPVSPTLVGAILKLSTTSWHGKAMPLIGPLPHGCFFFSEKSKHIWGAILCGLQELLTFPALLLFDQSYMS